MKLSKEIRDKFDQMIKDEGGPKALEFLFDHARENLPPHEFDELMDSLKHTYKVPEKISQCAHCKKTKVVKTVDDWQMQCLHFEDADIDFLTCDKCKKLDPMEWISSILTEQGD